ncbi:MAG TPA: hypothetical protein VJM51_00355 [Dehalococcoidia bacterium]|nr:hypothetical protein [Dehalococcoidia bacterium]
MTDQLNKLWGWRTFNDRLALLLLVVIPALWIVDARGWIKLSPEVTGALIMTWGLIVQFYFRKAPEAPKP